MFLYDSTYHPVFVDQKNTATEMILHGQRIATNGDVRLMPTPEQWDLVATLKGRQPDKAHNRLTANLAFPAFDLSYTLEVAAEPGGVKVSINLDKPLPQKLAGRAGFNLEFLPSIYMGKAYLVDQPRRLHPDETLKIRWIGPHFLYRPSCTTSGSPGSPV